MPGLAGFRHDAPEHYLSAADVSDDASVGGMIAFFFACFGAGTPNLDQFRKDPNDASTAVKLAEQPFVAALPRRLLAHPNGGALAVIGHVDRAWSFSIRPPSAAGPQIRTFINTLAFTLGGVRRASPFSRILVDGARHFRQICWTGSHRCRPRRPGRPTESLSMPGRSVTTRKTT